MTIKEGERLSVLETKVDRAVSDISDIKQQTTQEFAALNTKFDTFVDSLDKRYAAKWVQSAVGFVVALIVGAVLTALIALVVVPSFNSDKTTGSSTTTQTTTTTPTGSTSTSKTTPSPSASATSTATSTPANPTASDSSTSGGGVQVTLPKVGQ